MERAFSTRSPFRLRRIEGQTVERLLSQAETGDKGPIPLNVRSIEVREQAAPVADQLQETAPGVVVVMVAAEVLGELGDARRKESDLYFD